MFRGIIAQPYPNPTKNAFRIEYAANSETNSTIILLNPCSAVGIKAHL